MHREQFFSTAFFVSAGFWIWAAHFTVVYGFTALACARGIAEPQTVRIVIVALTVAAVAATLVHLATALRPRRGQTSRFLHDVAAMIAVLGIVSMIWTAAPVALGIGCG